MHTMRLPRVLPLGRIVKWKITVAGELIQLLIDTTTMDSDQARDLARQLIRAADRAEPKPEPRLCPRCQGAMVVGWTPPRGHTREHPKVCGTCIRELNHGRPERGPISIAHAYELEEKDKEAKE